MDTALKKHEGTPW